MKSIIFACAAVLLAPFAARAGFISTTACGGNGAFRIADGATAVICMPAGVTQNDGGMVAVPRTDVTTRFFRIEWSIK